jgi:hypothetical protein
VKHCVLCSTERDDVTAAQVLPATWNGFNNYADVCAECQESRRFKLWSKKTKPKAAAAADTPAPEGDGAAPEWPDILIAHRRTGVVLHTLNCKSLAGAALGDAALSGADLHHAALRGASFLRADLHLADLNGADLRETDLRGANCRGADLRGADLREARLYKTDLRQALYDTATRWPAGFDPLTCGAQWTDRRA